MERINVKIGAAKVDFKGLIIDGPSGPQSIEPMIIKLLRVLVENAGEVMTREELINSVWDVGFGGDERLSRAISILRKALGDTPGQHTHIVTISKVGYRLVAQVSDDTKAEAVLSPAAQKVETKPLSLNRRIKEFEHIAGGSKFSVWRLAYILTVTL